MLDEDRLSNLLFLMTLAPLATGCPGDDSSASDTTPGTSGAMTTGSTEPSTGAPPATGSGSEGADGTTSTTSGSSSTTDEPTSGTTTGGLTCDEEPPEVVGPINQACIDYAAVSNECLYGGELPQECLDLYIAYCQYTIESSAVTYGEACSNAYIDYLACLSLLSCEEINDADDDCVAEEMTLDATCV